MSLLAIVKEPNEILRLKAAKVKDPGSKEIQQLIADMIETMRSAKGVGLAAPQIGKSLKMCVIEESGEIYVLINPQITAKSKNQVVIEEGCLSIPGKYFEISRPESVKVRYIDQAGKNVKLKASGMLARVIQHELDHLDGILIIDKVSKRKQK